MLQRDKNQDNTLNAIKKFDHLISTSKNRIITVQRILTNQYLLLSGIVLLALVLRFYKLGEWSFWWDEMFTVRDAQNVFADFLNASPITFVLTHYSIAIFGLSEWSARLGAALIGVITVPVLFFMVRKIFGINVALIASLLLAISPWHLYWSQNARFYAALLLLYSLTLFSFYLWVEKREKKYLFLSAVFLAIAIWEKMSVLYIVPVIVLFLILSTGMPTKRKIKENLKYIAYFGIFLLILVALFARRLLLEPFLLFDLNLGWLNNNPFWIVSGVVYYIGVPTFIIATIGIGYLLVKDRKAGLLFGLSAYLPLILTAGLSLITFTANRYVFITLTSWILLASIAANELIKHTQGPMRLLSLSCLLVLILSPLSENVLYFQYQNGNRDNWKAAFQYIQTHRQENDIVVSANHLIGNYYMQETTLRMEAFDLNTINEFERRIWFVEDMNVLEKWPETHRWITTNTNLMAIFDVVVQARNFKMRVYLYDPTNP
jgi:mannosyltransferase